MATTLTGLFKEIADAIRSKTGKTDNIVANNFPTEITSISTSTDKAKVFSNVELAYTGSGTSKTYKKKSFLFEQPNPPTYCYLSIPKADVGFTPDAVLIICRNEILMHATFSSAIGSGTGCYFVHNTENFKRMDTLYTDPDNSDNYALPTVTTGNSFPYYDVYFMKKNT